MNDIGVRALNRALIPAIPTWYKRGGDGYELAYALNASYVKKLLDEPVAGIASLVHTGRGRFLTWEEKMQYLGEIVDICHDADKFHIIGVETIQDARLAKDLGFDMVLVFPGIHSPPNSQDPSDMDSLVQHHQEIARIHGFTCAFCLYAETAVGIQYDPPDLIRLLSIDGVNAVKFALLSDFEKLEDAMVAIGKHAPNTIMFTGEDRMFAESLEKTKDLSSCNILPDPPRINALTGLGSVLPALQVFMLKTFDKPEYSGEYMKVRALVAALARATFKRPLNDGHADYTLPMEGYISNVATGSAFQFNIPSNAISDIATIEKERIARGIPRIIGKALENHQAEQDVEEIIKLVETGLDMDRALKDKYGSQLDRIE
ncbi:hypothetical protein GF325_02695 [Candidatus Bathyarchaeota archaeon]|nr:hypothetical protein [Candidatus Bathyarchaeota archaeon]